MHGSDLAAIRKVVQDGDGQQAPSERDGVLTILILCLKLYVKRRVIDECAKSEDFKD